MLAQKHWQVFANGVQHLTGFFDEYFKYFIVNQVIVIGGLIRHGLNGGFFNDGFRGFLLFFSRVGDGVFDLGSVRSRQGIVVGATGGCHGLGPVDELLHVACGLAVLEFTDQ